MIIDIELKVNLKPQQPKIESLSYFCIFNFQQKKYASLQTTGEIYVMQKIIGKNVDWKQLKLLSTKQSFTEIKAFNRLLNFF